MPGLAGQPMLAIRRRAEAALEALAIHHAVTEGAPAEIVPGNGHPLRAGAARAGAGRADGRRRPGRSRRGEAGESQRESNGTKCLHGIHPVRLPAEAPNMAPSGPICCSPPAGFSGWGEEAPRPKLAVCPVLPHLYGMLLRIRPLLLAVLVLALALPMRLHGLMIAGPVHAAAALNEPAPPCHDAGGHRAGHPLPAAHGLHHTGPVEPAPIAPASDDRNPDHPAPSSKLAHASLHCATAGMVVPVRPVDVPAPHSLAIEALRPAEMPPGEGLAPPRQERPPRLPA